AAWRVIAFRARSRSRPDFTSSPILKRRASYPSGVSAGGRQATFAPAWAISAAVLTRVRGFGSKGRSAGAGHRHLLCAQLGRGAVAVRREDVDRLQLVVRLEELEGVEDGGGIAAGDEGRDLAVQRAGDGDAARLGGTTRRGWRSGTAHRTPAAR